MLRIGEFQFDAGSREVVGSAATVRISPKSAGVLAALAESPGRVWSRDAIMERVWPCVTVGEEVLTHAIAELRRAFGDDSRAPRYIETVHKHGYRLLQSAIEAAGPPASLTPPAGAAGFDLDVYASCLAACDLYERGGRHNTLSAIALYSSATGRRPDYAPAHAGLARALTFYGAYYDPRPENFERAREHCALALGTGQEAHEALAVLGLLFAIGGDFPRGLANFSASLKLKPDSAETHYLLGRACFAEGDFRSAAIMLERAASLRADDYHSLVMAAKARQKTGDPRQTTADFAQASRRIETRLASHPDEFRALCGKAHCLLYFGQSDDAYALMSAIDGHPDPMTYYLATAYACAGDADRAIPVLDAVVQEGWRHGRLLARDPDFDLCRGDRRFRRIAASAGMAA